ncbi:MAG: hypothetical protein JSW60_08920 [Thermoplasmatales archaeon]|nr:MAG: hypothetical protein JSW60_08920 [Thermoplasmatales archaeon]
MKKILTFGIMLLFLGMTVSTTGLHREKQNNDVEKVSTISGDDIEIYIYAGILPRYIYTKGPSIGFGIMMEVFNNLSEALVVYWQRDYYTLLSGEPLDPYGWGGSFVVPPNDSTWAGSSGWVGIPCRLTVTVQAGLIKYVSRSGFQIRRLVFFPGEK